jgi:uncharacterized protein (TIGR02145 family)
MERATSALMSVCVAASLLLSCSDELKPIERETWEEYQRTLSSSGRAANLSSSSEAANSSSAVSSSSEEPSSSSGTAIPSSSSSVSVCWKTQYDPDVQFCHNDYIIDKCGGKEFNPPEEVCNTGVVGKLCGSTWYNLQTHFCFGGTTPTPFCGGEEYTGSQFCRNGKVYDKCGSIGEYDPSKFYCHNGSLSSCGSLPFNPDTQFCSGSMRYDKCGGSDYNPDTNFCLSSTITPLCGGQTFTSSQFCSANDIHNKCGGTMEFVPGTEDCCGSGKYTIATHFCYNNSKVGSKCGTRTEIFNPDLYECREVSKIYLKTPVNYEGENYEAVLIGTQIWMAENLNYKTPDGTSRCYPTSGNTNDSDADNSNCSIYGRLYNWSTAMNIDAGYNTSLWNGSDANHKGICPTGWHIPSSEDWGKLSRYVDGTSGSFAHYVSNTAGKYLKAVSDWYGGNGTDDFGFSALPGGYGFSDGSFDVVGRGGSWWSASEGNSGSAYLRGMYFYDDYAYWGYDDKSNLFSVRCLKD